jgi:hypothetical protein
LGPFCPGGYDADSFSKARHACLQFTQKARPNFCNHESRLDLHLTFSLPHKGHQDRDIGTASTKQDRKPKMSPYTLRALDYVSNRHQNNKPFNPDHLLPTQRKKTFAVRLHRSHLVLAVEVVCRCTCPNTGCKAKYAVRGDGPGCFHTIRTHQRRRRHRPG